MLDRLLFLGQELELQGRHDCLGNLILDGEDIGEVAVVAVGPDMVAGLAVDQLGVDPHPVAGLADAAFEHMGDIELARDLADIESLALERECGVPGNDREGRDLREVGDDVVGYPVAEIFLLRVAAQIDERQHADRDPTRGLAFDLSRSARFGSAADQQGDASFDLAPGGVAGVPAPAAEIRALDLVEGHRWKRAVERDLDQGSGFAGHVGFRAHPLGTHGLGRPQHDDRLGRADSLLDDVAVRAVRRKLVVAPHCIARAAQCFGNLMRLPVGGPAIGNENVGHRKRIPRGARERRLSKSI